MGEEYKEDKELLIKMRDVLVNSDPNRFMFDESIDLINDYLAEIESSNNDYKKTFLYGYDNLDNDLDYNEYDKTH